MIKAAIGLRSRLEAAAKSAFSDGATTCAQNQSAASESFARGDIQSSRPFSDRTVMSGDTAIRLSFWNIEGCKDRVSANSCAMCETKSDVLVTCV